MNRWNFREIPSVHKNFYSLNGSYALTNKIEAHAITDKQTISFFIRKIICLKVEFGRFYDFYEMLLHHYT